MRIVWSLFSYVPSWDLFMFIMADHDLHSPSWEQQQKLRKPWNCIVILRIDGRLRTKKRGSESGGQFILGTGLSILCQLANISDGHTGLLPSPTADHSGSMTKTAMFPCHPKFSKMYTLTHFLRHPRFVCQRTNFGSI